MYCEIVWDVNHVYESRTETEPALVAEKLTGMHRMVTIMRDYGALSHDEAVIIRQFIRDCRDVCRGGKA